MVKKTAKSIAVQPSRGEKITFDETSQEDSTPIVASTSSHSAPGPEHDDPAEQSEDDAPEAMGLSDVKAVEMKEVELVNQAKRARKEAAVARSRKIAESKPKPKTPATNARNLPKAPAVKRQRASDAAQVKNKHQEVEDDDDDEEDDPQSRRLRARMERAMQQSPDQDEEETSPGSEEDGSDAEEDDPESRRLRARMERAMEEGSDESSGSNSNADEDSGEDDSEAAGQSYHTESEGEEDREDLTDEEEEDEDDEKLTEGPIDDDTKRLRAKMQAAMEAAERRAGVPVAPKSKAIDGQAEEGDDEQWDLGPLAILGKPLSASVLRAAEAADAEKKARAAEVAARAKVVGKQADGRGVKRKRKRTTRVEQEVERQVSDKKTLHLLPPTLDTASTSLPPVLEAHARPVAAKDPRKVFYKMAMEESGRIPGRGMVDGRRKLVALSGRDVGAR